MEDFYNRKYHDWVRILFDAWQLDIKYARNEYGLYTFRFVLQIECIQFQMNVWHLWLATNINSRMAISICYTRHHRDDNFDVITMSE